MWFLDFIGIAAYVAWFVWLFRSLAANSKNESGGSEDAQVEDLFIG